MSYINGTQEKTPHSKYTAARATPDLVGRQDILSKIIPLLHSADAAIVYIQGEGGIGKTRLVDYLVNEYSLTKAEEFTCGLIDLYHASNYSVEGLIDSIQRQIDPGGIHFEEYLKQRKIRDEYMTIRSAGSPGELHKQREKTITAFRTEFNKFAKQKRVVLALDTAEKLFYQADPVAEELGLAEEHPPVLHWLVDDFLPNIDNAFILLAGRPGPVELQIVLSEIEKITFEYFYLQGLTEQESMAYIDSVVEALEQDTTSPENQASIERINEWDANQRQVLFYALCDATGDDKDARIRPILLALAIDQLVVAGQPPESLLKLFKQPLDEVKTLTLAQRKRNQELLGEALVTSLHDSYRPADEVFLTLGWLRKGVTNDLLLKIMGYNAQEVEEDKKTAQEKQRIIDALEQLKTLSFIKIRPSDERIFLHDEVYDIIQKHALNVWSEPKRQRIFSILDEYYEAEIDKIWDEIDNLYVPLAEFRLNILPDASRVIETRNRLQEAIVEDLHYHLRWDAQQGFEEFYRYSEEAVITGDDSLLTQLRAELETFLAEKDPTGQMDEIDGLSRAVIKADAAIRWVKWLWSDNRIDKALALVDRIKSEFYDWIKAGGYLTVNELDSWHGYLLTYKSRYREATGLLEASIKALRAQPQTNSIRWAGILAAAFSQLAYLYRVQARLHRAIATNQLALPLWRKMKFEAQQANTLNNLSFASALIGNFEAAEQQAKDGLRLRERLGPRQPVGLSVNTLGLIAIHANNQDSGLRRTERALDLFNTLEDERGIGLALTARAEARRRMSGAVSARQEKRVAEWLAEAVTLAERTEEIFATKVPETSRRIAALIEVGCAYRDWAQLRRDNTDMLAPIEREQNHTFTMEELAAKSRAALQHAAELAADSNDDVLRLDALINEAWLDYYIGVYVTAPKFEQARQHLEEKLTAIEKSILDYYGIEDLTLLLSPEMPRDSALIQLGKLEILRGQIAFNQFERGKKENIKDLAEGITHYTLALAFHERFSPYNFAQKRRGIARIYERLSKLSTDNLTVVYETVSDVEKKYNLGQSRMRQFLESRFGPADLITLF